MSRKYLFYPDTFPASSPPCRPVVPMDYMGDEYFKLKASIIKYERFVLKVS